MADGTIKQVNPFSGTEVWTVPGRGNRPLGIASATPAPLAPDQFGRFCAFCEHRYLETPPEKARMVRSGRRYRTVAGLRPLEMQRQVAEFRRIPNLFEIVSYDYWHANYGYRLDEPTQARRSAYLADPAGRQHVLGVLRAKLKAAGVDDEAWVRMPEQEKLAHADSFFAGCHDVIVARRHYVDGATTDAELASSGTLTPAEHRAYTAFTVDTMASLYRQNRYARYVAAFQNWLKPAGASFDHLHKQLVAIDDRGVQTELELMRVRQNGNLYNELAVGYAGYQNLVFAENDYAVAFAGFGHRYPSLEVYSKSAACRPWEHSAAEIAGMSDLIHAIHAATGPDVPCNEEWHHQPPDVDIPMPWRVVVKWRVSTLAGFEGGTRIYLNTIDPWNLRDRVVPRLFDLRDRGKIAADTRLAEECECAPNALKYNPNLR